MTVLAIGSLFLVAESVLKHQCPARSGQTCLNIGSARQDFRRPPNYEYLDPGLKKGKSVDLQNNRVYRTKDIEQWLSECAGLKQDSRAWKQALKEARQTVFGPDVYFFEPVSDTHYRVHRADAEGVQNIFKVLDEATSSRGQRLRLFVLTGLALMLCSAGAIGLVLAIVRHFVFHTE